jgi:phosphatidylglycerophosphate synthase
MAHPAAPANSPWRTRANALTALRLLAAPALAAAVGAGAPGIALALFVFAVATDLLDGRVARRFGESSPLGGFLDHLCDATFVATGLAAFARRGELPALLPWLVALAFLQYTLDSRALAAARGEAGGAPPLRASALGRWNGIAYFALLGIPVVRDGLALGWPSAGAVYAAGVLLVASTLVSMADRARALWLRSGAPGPRGLGRRLGAEELAVGAAQEDEADRRVEEHEEVVLHEPEGRHRPGLLREQGRPERHRHGAEGPGHEGAEEDER